MNAMAWQYDDRVLSVGMGRVWKIVPSASVLRIHHKAQSFKASLSVKEPGSSSAPATYPTKGGND